MSIQYFLTDTGDPSFTRFQLARIHTPRFFQDFRSMGNNGFYGALWFSENYSQTCQKQQKSIETKNLALNQCFLSIENI